jgi:hypothetical protein
VPTLANGLAIRVPTGYRIERPHTIYNDTPRLWHVRIL